jgi:hypothetical protein
VQFGSKFVGIEAVVPELQAAKKLVVLVVVRLGIPPPVLNYGVVIHVIFLKQVRGSGLNPLHMTPIIQPSRLAASRSLPVMVGSRWWSSSERPLNHTANASNLLEKIICIGLALVNASSERFL